MRKNRGKGKGDQKQRGQRTRKRLVCLAGLVGCLTAATASPAAQADLDAHNVVIVLDASGSMRSKMRGTNMVKMDAAKQALLKVLTKVPQDTQIGLLVFSAGNIRRGEEWVYPLGPRDDERLKEAINLPQPRGDTPLGAYIKRGADRLLEQRDRQFGYGTYRLLVVTDGQAGDPEYVERYVPEVLARGITIDVIGVDMRSDHMLATRVHSYRRANDPASLERAVEEVFAEVGAPGADDAIGEEAFAEIAPLPDEVARAMVQALAATDNTEIGQGVQAAVSGRSAPQRPPVQAQPRPSPQSQPGGRDGDVPMGLLVVIMFGVFLAVLALRRQIRY